MQRFCNVVGRYEVEMEYKWNVWFLNVKLDVLTLTIAPPAGRYVQNLQITYIFTRLQSFQF